MIDLQLLGGLDLASLDLPATARARRRHPMMLLAVVAAAAPQPVTRDRLMALLWPESDADRASNSLRQALHALRRDLGEDLFLPESTSGLRLDPDRLRVDLWSFREAVAHKSYEEAVATHRGAFLDGMHAGTLIEFNRWADTERAVVERAYLDALDALGRHAERDARWNDAVTWRRRQAAADPCSSRAALGLLRALTAAGDKPGALAYAAVHESFLRAHLEVEPDRAVTDFVAALRQVTPPGGVAIPPIRAAAVASLAPTLEPGLNSHAPAPLRPTAASPVPAALARRGWMRRPSRMLGLACAALGLVGVGASYSMVRSPDRVITLTSGASDESGRDTANMLVECIGPACPTGTLPQPAFVVPKHEAYTDPPPASAYIAPIADGTTVKDPGYKCCTRAVFEQTFRLPLDAVAGTITIQVAADNQAAVAMNGVEFGRQADSLQQWNFSGPETTFTSSFVPAPSGINKLRVTLWDGGGVMGLNYRAFVRYSRIRRTDSAGR